MHSQVSGTRNASARRVENSLERQPRNTPSLAKLMAADLNCSEPKRDHMKAGDAFNQISSFKHQVDFKMEEELDFIQNNKESKSNLKKNLFAVIDNVLGGGPTC